MRAKEDLFFRRVGENVAKARKARGLTQLAFTAEYGVDRNLLGRIERGEQNCSLDTLRRIAIGLDMPVAAFFDGVDVELLRASMDDDDECAL